MSRVALGFRQQTGVIVTMGWREMVSDQPGEPNELASLFENVQTNYRQLRVELCHAGLGFIYRRSNVGVTGHTRKPADRKSGTVNLV
jgi:hypothetical protein